MKETPLVEESPLAQPIPFAEVLGRLTGPGELCQKHADGSVTCFACGHRCLIRPGREGICKVRFNREGELRVPRGYVGALQVDPIEKKPFFHVLPSRLALSFGMLGCDYHCSYCQNWITSQALRDPQASADPERVTAGDLVRLARHRNAPILASTYNEPLITSEWAVEIFKKAREAGFLCAYVSNGNGTEEVLQYLRPWVDLYKVDLKSIREPSYRALGGQLGPVLDTIRRLKELEFWVEVVTLVISGFNDSQEELRDIARFLVSVSPDIPWHVTAFHKNYKMTDPADTTPEDLLRAAEIGKKEGLRFIYAGNLPGQVENLENSYCPDCRALLVERHGYHIRQILLDGSRCPDCRQLIPGVWQVPGGAGENGSGPRH